MTSLLLMSAVLGGPVPFAPPVAAAGLSIAVSGNKLVDGAGTAVRLAGFNRSGSEYQCQQSNQIFEGPTDQAAIDLMKNWKANFVRVPLNEHCWLGIAGRTTTTGVAYRSAIIDWVNRLNANGLYVMLDLHFTGPFGPPAQQDWYIANRQYSIPFWQSVATTFKANTAVMFELVNEAHDISWQCWRDGCDSSQGFAAAGMQELINAIRATGAKQPVVVNGLDWGNDLREFNTWKPTDPAGQLIVGTHQYNFKRCANIACYNAEFAPIAAVHPFIGPEIGENDCSAWFVTEFMNWMNANGGDGYGIWHFGTGECPPGYFYGGSALLSEWTGTPTAYGAGVKSFFATLSGGPNPPPTVMCTNSQFSAQYFNNITFTGTPALSRCETSVNNDWGSGGPGSGVGVDNFSARWTTTRTFAAGTYNFSITGDDGIRLYVDNVLVADGWKDQAATTYTAQRTLTAGPHQVKVEYYERGGGAVAKASWVSATPVSCTSSQWSAQYFNNTTLTGVPVLSRCEATINNDWGGGGPGSGVASDNFSAQWSTTRSFAAGTYNFSITGDDGIRLFVDNVLVVDGWRDQATTTYVAQRTLTAGAHTVRVEYYDRGGGAVAKASFVSAGT